VGAKTREIDKYKLWHSGGTKVRNGVGILVDKELVDQVVEVRHKSDNIMLIKLVVGVEILNVICIYVPQIGLADDIKWEFWEALEKVMQSLPQSEKLFLGAYFNGPIRTKAYGYDMTCGGFGYSERNNDGVSILNFVIAYDSRLLTSILRRRRTTS